MSSAGGGKKTDIFIKQELENGKVYCSYMGVSGVFHTLPTHSELAKISKIMAKYKCKTISEVE